MLRYCISETRVALGKKEKHAFNKYLLLRDQVAGPELDPEDMAGMQKIHWGGKQGLVHSGSRKRY